MATTQQDQAVAVVNLIINLTATLYDLQQQINRVSFQWTNLSVATKLQSAPTAVQTATGGLGAADGSPNVAHPIDTRIVSAISNPISATDLASLLTYLQGIATAIGGGALLANNAAPQLVALTSR